MDTTEKRRLCLPHADFCIPDLMCERPKLYGRSVTSAQAKKKKTFLKNGWESQGDLWSQQWSEYIYIYIYDLSRVQTVGFRNHIINWRSTVYRECVKWYIYKYVQYKYTCISTVQLLLNQCLGQKPHYKDKIMNDKYKSSEMVTSFCGWDVRDCSSSTCCPGSSQTKLNQLWLNAGILLIATVYDSWGGTLSTTVSEPF